MADSVSTRDLARSLATQTSRDAALIRATTELFAKDGNPDPDAVRRFEDIVLHLIDKVGDADLRFVSESLARHPHTPVAVATALAKRGIDIAAPIIRSSPVLGALDLLLIIAATGPEHHRLIAARPGLSSDLRTVLCIDGPAEEPGDVPGPEPHRSGTAIAASVQIRAGGARSRRLDPWLFLDLERRERLRLMAELSGSPPPPRTAANAHGAFRSILSAAQLVSHARTRRRDAFVDAVAEGLRVGKDFVHASLDDATGEPIAVLLKALSLDAVQAQQIFLLMAPKVGQDTAVFFRLCDLYAGMEPHVADTLAQAWRDDREPRRGGHQPLFVETRGDARAAAETARDERRTPADAKRTAGGAA